MFNLFIVTFDICTGRYQPYKKMNDTPTYINVNSNHLQRNIMKTLLNIISKRISNISSSKATFNIAVFFYNILKWIKRKSKRKLKPKKDNMV